MRFILKTVFIFIVSLTAIQAQEGLIRVKSQVDTSVITIGDLVTYSIIIDRVENLRIARPGEGVTLGMFEIKGYNFYEPVQKDGRIIEQFDFKISVYDTGRFEIPAFPVAYFIDDTTSKYNMIDAPAINIYVKSVISGDDAKELKDIKPPLEIPFDWKYWLLIGGISLLFLATGYFVYRVWKKKKEKGYLFVPPPPPVPAHEAALTAINKLLASDLIEKKEYKKFFSELSEIIRIYIEGRYYLKALEETTSEIVRDIKPHLNNETLLLSLCEQLMLADLVKFAKHTPEQDEIERAGSRAVDFVEDTKIIYELDEKQAKQQEELEQIDTPEQKALAAPAEKK